MEARKHSKHEKYLEEFEVGDILYIKATAWEKTTYKSNWPYDVDISMAYFEAQVESILKETRVRLSFVAFEINGRKAEFARSFLGNFAVKSLPVGAMAISREMYDEIEHEKIDGQINDLDEFEAEKSLAADSVRRTRYFFSLYFSISMKTSPRLAVKKRRRNDSAFLLKDSPTIAGLKGVETSSLLVPDCVGPISVRNDNTLLLKDSPTIAGLNDVETSNLLVKNCVGPISVATVSTSDGVLEKALPIVMSRRTR